MSASAVSPEDGETVKARAANLAAIAAKESFERIAASKAVLQEAFEEALAHKVPEDTTAVQNVPQVAAETQAMALEAKSQANAAAEGRRR